MPMRLTVAALAVLALLAAVVYADPADEARARDAREAAEKKAKEQAEADKRRASDEARRAEEARKSGATAMPVMLNNRFINPITGKEVGKFAGGSTYLPAMPGALDNWYWVTDARDSKITLLVDVHTQAPADPGASPFTVEGKTIKRTAGVNIGDPSDEGGPGGQPKVLRGKPWDCELPGRILSDKPGWFSENDDKLFVAYEGGVAHVNNLDGKIVWTSPGASGSLYPWIEYIFSAGDSKLCARNIDKGEIVWSQELGPDADILHVQECVLPGELEGRYVLAARNGGSSPATRWFSLDGKPLMSINERAEQVIYGSDWQVLTPTRYAQINRDGSAAWEVKRDKSAFEADAWVFRGEGVIRLQWGPISDSGVKVELRHYGAQKPTWTHECASLEVPHSKYWHKVYSRVLDGKLIVVSQAAGGNFIEVLDLASGKQIARHKP